VSRRRVIGALTSPLRMLADMALLIIQVRQETRTLAQANRQLTQYTQRMEEAIRRLRRHSHNMKRLAMTDPLTKLSNRRAIGIVANHEIRRRGRTRQPLALGLIDVDRFKRINRQHLLPGGDACLVALAKTLSACSRESDRVGRVGGDEFLLVAPDTDLKGAGTLGERIRSTVEQTSVNWRGQTIQFTVTIGFAVAPSDAEFSFDALREVAAAALAEAKRKGGNRCVIRAL